MTGLAQFPRARKKRPSVIVCDLQAKHNYHATNPCPLSNQLTFAIFFLFRDVLSERSKCLCSRLIPRETAMETTAWNVPGEFKDQLDLGGKASSRPVLEEG